MDGTSIEGPIMEVEPGQIEAQVKFLWCSQCGSSFEKRELTQYTERNLTRDQDKLPALWELANLVATKTDDGYAAGLWKRDVIEDLLWSIEVIEPSHYCDDPAHDAMIPLATKPSVKHPTQYRAPSWSWASLDGKIKYYHLEEAYIRARCLDIQVAPVRKDKVWQSANWMDSNRGLSDGKGPQPLRSYQAIFDDEPYFPSFALMLDHEKALILKANGLRTFTRIGMVKGRAVEPTKKGKNESERPEYSIEDTEAIEIANRLPQVITIY